METFIVNEKGERNKGGKIVCCVCGNNRGIRWTKNRRGNDPTKWTDRKTCPDCKTTERSKIYTGEIIDQKLGIHKGKL
jgi:hypothetical protein